MAEKILFDISALIATVSNVADPVTPVVVIPTPLKPSVIFPAVLALGVIDWIVRNVFEPITVALEAGPVITSVCALPLISVPTTVNVFELSSPLALVILALFPVVSAKAAAEPTFTPAAAAFDAICVTVLNKFVEVTVLPAVGPQIVSVKLVPVTLVPVIVNDTDERLLELEIVICEFNPLAAALF